MTVFSLDKPFKMLVIFNLYYLFISTLESKGIFIGHRVFWFHRSLQVPLCKWLTSNVAFKLFLLPGANFYVFVAHISAGPNLQKINK